MNDIKIELPTKELLDQILEKIKNNLHDDVDINQVINWFTRFMICSHYSHTENLTLYRCSRITSDSNRNINEANTFSYPKSEYCKIGRCNIDKKPVLYLSHNPNTTFFEINAKVGEIVFLSKWVFRPKNNVNIMNFFFYLESFQKDTYAYEYSINMVEKLRSLINESLELSDIDRKGLFYFLEKMDEIITLRSPIYYDLTSKMCDKVFSGFGDINFDVIAYPSVSTDLDGVNFAFNTKLVDNGSVYLNGVVKVKIKAMNRNYLILEFLEEGIIDGCIVNWCELKDDSVKI